MKLTATISVLILTVIVTVSCANLPIKNNTENKENADNTGNTDKKDWLNELANYSCEKENCLPFLPDVCPFQFLCDYYCKRDNPSTTVGLCNNSKCNCYDPGNKTKTEVDV